MKEVKHKRYAGPYKDPPFEHFIQSPVGLVPKDGGTKTRLIFHLSHPRGTGRSVNANTPKEKCSVRYPDFDQAIRLVQKFGKFCKLGKSDLTSAFRHAPIRKRDWMLLVIKAESPIDGNLYYFVDKCLPFGHTLSCAIFQAISDGISAIMEYKTGKENINYLDDFLFADFLRSLCNEQIDLFIKTCQRIGFPVSMDKTFWATGRLTFLGLLIDAFLQLVCIPHEKVEVIENLISVILSRKSKKVTLVELQRICGHLNFICKSVVPGRAFTRRMYMATKGLRKPHHHTNVDKQLKLDLQMWLTFLRFEGVFSRPFLDFSLIINADEINFYTDASRNPNLGMGGVCEKAWFIKRWNPDFIRAEYPSIAFLELYALAVGVLLWAENYANKRIVIFCDNQSVVHMVNSTTSACKQCLKLLRIIVLHSMIYNVRIFARYVHTKRNIRADLLSRLKLTSFLRVTKGTMKCNPDPLPVNLWPMEKVWNTD